MKTIKHSFVAGLAAWLFLTSCGHQKGKYDASGVFEATEVLVSSQAGGQLMAFNVVEGQPLEAGQAVGYVDTTQLYLKKRQLLASIKSVDSRRMDVNKQIAAIKEQVEKQRTEQRRFENLVKSNAANQKQLDDINSQITVLEKQLAAQMEALESNNRAISGESASMEIQVAQIQDQIQKSVISCPINGTVLSKYAEQGEITAPGKALFRMANMNELFLRAYITAGQLTQMKIGDTVRVFSDFGENDKREYSGTITWVSDQAEFTPKTIQTRDERANLVYAVKISVKNDGYLKRGMYGELILRKK